MRGTNGKYKIFVKLPTFKTMSEIEAKDEQRAREIIQGMYPDAIIETVITVREAKADD